MKWFFLKSWKVVPNYSLGSDIIMCIWNSLTLQFSGVGKRKKVFVMQLWLPKKVILFRRPWRDQTESMNKSLPWRRMSDSFKWVVISTRVANSLVHFSCLNSANGFPLPSMNVCTSCLRSNTSFNIFSRPSYRTADEKISSSNSVSSFWCVS